MKEFIPKRLEKREYRKRRYDELFGNRFTRTKAEDRLYEYFIQQPTMGRLLQENYLGFFVDEFRHNYHVFELCVTGRFNQLSDKEWTCAIVTRQNIHLCTDPKILSDLGLADLSEIKIQ